MSIWALLFPGKEARNRRVQEEAELARHEEERRQTLQTMQSGSRVMKTMAGAMQMMARREDDAE